MRNVLVVLMLAFGMVVFAIGVTSSSLLGTLAGAALFGLGLFAARGD